MRQIVLDTETTGLEPSAGHRVIEIGCIELVDRRITGKNWHERLNPDCDISAEASAVHGITSKMLFDEPHFSDIVGSFIDFIRGAELIIHNATFDVGFLNNELNLLGKPWGRIQDYCPVITDTLKIARAKFPGQKNSLDGLCKRFGIDNSHREWHGAMLDASILVSVYLAMTSGQKNLFLGESNTAESKKSAISPLNIRHPVDSQLRPPLITLSAEEELAHQKYLVALDKSSGGKCLWQQLEMNYSVATLPVAGSH